MKLSLFSISAVMILLSWLSISAQPTSGSGLRNIQSDGLDNNELYKLIAKESQFRQELETNKKTFGDEHPNTIEKQNELATVLEKITKIVEVKGEVITKNSEIFFKQGLISLQDNRRSQARVDFDRAVEVFLMSNDHVYHKYSKKLNNCYNNLIETIYRMEFPSSSQPNIKGLADVCGWKIDGQLADSVAKLSQALPQNTNASNVPSIKAVVDDENQGDFQQVGFLDQRFMPTAGDELAALSPELAEEDVRLKKTVTTKVKPKSVIKVVASSKLLDSIGSKPKKLPNGQYSIILKYINDTFNDPYSVKYLNWSEPVLKSYSGNSFWVISVKLRAKNLFNAYRLTVINFYIKQNKIAFSNESVEDNVFYQSKEIAVEKPVLQTSTTTKDLQIVKAKQGDTIAKIAARFGISPATLANLNGMTSIDTPLAAGREIRVQAR